jgi:hypothetical protein
MGDTAFPRDSKAAEGYARDTPHALAAPWHIKARLCTAFLKTQSAFVHQIAKLSFHPETGVIATEETRQHRRRSRAVTPHDFGEHS